MPRAQVSGFRLPGCEGTRVIRVSRALRAQAARYQSACANAVGHFGCSDVFRSRKSGHSGARDTTWDRVPGHPSPRKPKSPGTGTRVLGFPDAQMVLGYPEMKVPGQPVLRIRFVFFTRVDVFQGFETSQTVSVFRRTHRVQR